MLMGTAMFKKKHKNNLKHNFYTKKKEFQYNGFFKVYSGLALRDFTDLIFLFYLIILIRFEFRLPYPRVTYLSRIDRLIPCAM